MKKVKLLFCFVCALSFSALDACPSSVNVCGGQGKLDATRDFINNCSTNSILLIDVCGGTSSVVNRPKV